MVDDRAAAWLYEVTGVDPGQDAFVPGLNGVPSSWLTELPPWWGNVDQYSLIVSNGQQYGDRGRIAGLIANEGQCFLNESNYCLTPPPVDEEEKFVYQGNVETLEGDLVPVSILAATKGHHFSDSVEKNILANQGFLSDQFQPLQNSHDIMAHQLAFGRYINVEGGVAFVGALFPHVSVDMVARLNASAISGHWIYDQTEQKHIFAGAVFVNQPGFPLANKKNLELRNIAGAFRYNHIMAQEVPQEAAPCACKTHVAAATDPQYQNTTGELEAIKIEEPDVTINDLAEVSRLHSQQIATLEKEVMKLIRQADQKEEGAGVTG